MRTLSQIGEFGLIDRIRRKAAHASSVIKGIGDDAAVVDISSGKKILLTTDMMVEGVHFTRRMSARAIGHKALACNISDIAAMGGVSKHAVISLGVSKEISLQFIDQLYAGIFKLAKKFDVSIVGGDTVKSEKIVINIALTGEVDLQSLVTRSKAKKGDYIFVTGPLGRSFITQHHLRFVPRLKESQFLVKYFKPSAMIDISDGLAADLGHVLEESHVGAIIEEKQIPRRNKASLEEALYDGEDFELLFTLSSHQAERLINAKNKMFRFYPIGRIVDQSKHLQLMDGQGKKHLIRPKGFVHF